MSKAWSASVVLLVLGVSPLGCSSSEGEEEGVDEGQIVSVADLDVLETELGLTKDTKDTHGQYHRGDAKLKAGGCYKATKGSASAADFEFRRYTQGIAAFRKKGTGAASGDERPIVCVDLDTKDIENKPYTAYVGRLELDTLIRYHLGREQGDEGAAGSTYVRLQRGAFRLSNVATLPSGTKHSLDVPVFRGKRFTELGVGDKSVDAGIVSLVQRYAWNRATGFDDFRLAKDPFGKFVSVGNDANGQHVHYERLDAHRLINVDGPGTETLSITAKGAVGAAVDGQAIVSCTRKIDLQEAPASKFACKGLGDPVKPEATEAAIQAGCATCGIVPGKSMRGVRPQMTEGQVRNLLGTPDRIETSPHELFEYVTDYIYGYTTVSFYEGEGGLRVVGIDTKSPKIQFANGIGVGSTKADLKAKVAGVKCDSDVPWCELGEGDLGSIVTTFDLDGGKVASVSIFSIVID